MKAAFAVLSALLASSVAFGMGAHKPKPGPESCVKGYTWVDSFPFYNVSESQKSYAKMQAENLAEKVGGFVVERTASFEVYACK